MSPTRCKLGATPSTTVRPSCVIRWQMRLSSWSNRTRPARLPHMGHDLYDQENVFSQTVDQCCELALQHGWLSRSLRPLLYPAHTDSSQERESGLNLAAMLGRSQPASSAEQALLQQTEYAQPAVFIIEYALAQLLLSWGLQPQALIGYSLG